MAAVHRLDGEWLLATDPANAGRARGYPGRPAPEARPCLLPGAIEETFPGYDGVVWYWLRFAPPEAARAGTGGTPWSALRVGAADYLAEVWLNGRHLGAHEGGETPFTLELGDALRRGENLLALRLLHTGDDPIDGVEMRHAPHGIKSIPFRPGAFHNYGGVWQSVELLARPATRVEDVFVEPRLDNGEARAHVTLRNGGAGLLRARLETVVADAVGGAGLVGDERTIELPPGEARLEVALRVPGHRAWSLEAPALYRLSARLEADGGRDQRDARFGFREFTFRDGYFRLNDQRLLLKGTHTVGHYPIGLVLPRGPEQLRQELLNLKLMGLNCCRSLGRLMFPEQLDLCDELGLMVYQETLAAWGWESSPEMPRRFDLHVREMILRDRNHPSVTIWGLMNETRDPEIVRHAAGMLPLVRGLDPTRMVMFNSGSWHDEDAWYRAERAPIGPCALPYEGEWSQGFADWHRYVTRPLEDGAIEEFRTRGRPDHKLFLSEYGNGSAIDPIRVARLFEESGGPRPEGAGLDDEVLYRRMAARLEADFGRLGVDRVFATPSDLVRASEARHAEHRAYAIGLLRSNPHLVGYSITGMLDHTMVGEGLMTIFREPKRATIDELHDAFRPAQWSLIVDRPSVYRGESVRVEGLLSDEDVLRPGVHPARLRIVGPDGPVFERGAEVRIVGAAGDPDRPFVHAVFDERIAVDGPPGRYEARVFFDRGSAALGRAAFYVSEPLGRATGQVALWDEGEQLFDWLGGRGLAVGRFDPASPGRTAGTVLVNRPALAPGPAGLGPLLDWIERGGTAVFLTPSVFGLHEENRHDVWFRGALDWCPFGDEVALKQARGCWWAVDHVLREHPLLRDLPTRRLMDLTFYRAVHPRWTYIGLRDGDVAVAGVGIGTCGEMDNYFAGADLIEIPWGGGRAVLSTLLIDRNVGRDPAADRLLLNLATAAAR
ncbi:MAG TPA: glycoside hydrolase family 2 TIM barrel-domain containing protein [Chloroflexota bacterium]|nr:glycoside hydrolase family 2 TIM barrel-domain containing protein [Chloroflexota bacterium]